jgi:PTH1 family peptidyl-tRNA hydrolase
VVDELASRYRIRFKSKDKAEAEIGQGEVAGQRCTLVKPLTYMNDSGWAVSAVMDYYDAGMSDMIVVYDDIDIPFGELRIRARGSAGTHNGMRSVIGYMGSGDFVRLRVGIGKPAHDLIAHVLGKFDKEARGEAEEMFRRAADACECILKEGLQKAQELYQSK